MISAIIAHGLFNLLIQSRHRWAAYAVILFMYAPQLLMIVKKLIPGRSGGEANVHGGETGR